MTITRKNRGKQAAQPFDSEKIETVITYLNRTADVTVVKDAVVARYARAIQQPKDLLTDERGADPRYAAVRKATEEAIRDGIYEIVLLRWLQRVCQETATLYTEPGASWQYVDDDDNEMDGVAETLAQYRERGGFNVAMPVADALSVGIGSEAVYVTWEARGNRYQPLAVSRFHVRFPATVDDNGQTRPANPQSIDDAECVTIMLSGTLTEDDDSGRCLFVSWHGASDKWPSGRVCMWQGADVTAIPPEPSVGVQDFTTGGMVDNAAPDDCINPLTLMAIESDSDWSCPEYPITILYDDGIAQADQLIRTTGLSRYDLSIEVDIAASRLTTSMLRSARGVSALSNPKGAPLPQGWDEGMVALYRDQVLALMAQPIANSEGALNMLHRIMRDAAEADGVAGYLVAGDTGQDVASGRALMVATAPMVRRRNGRIRVNSMGQARLFAIERAWINYSGEDFIPWEAREKWTPGELTFPGDSQIDEQVSGTQYTDKAINRVERVRRAYGLDTSEDAKAKIDAMAEDEKENEAYGWPATTKPQAMGMFGGGGGAGNLAALARTRKGATNGPSEKAGAGGTDPDAKGDGTPKPNGANDETS